MSALNNKKDSLTDLYERACEKADQKQWSDAVTILTGVCDITPANFAHQIKLIECLINAGDYNAASEELNSIDRSILSANEQGQYDAAQIVLAHKQGKYSEAYNLSLSLPERLRRAGSVRDVILSCLSRVRFINYTLEAENDVLYLFNEPLFPKGKTHFLATSLLKLKYSLGQTGINLNLRDLAVDELLLTTLKSDYVKGIDIESFLLLSRKALLTHSLSAMDLPDDLVPLVSAIAWQNWHNEYVHQVSKEENLLLEQLENLLMGQVKEGLFNPKQMEGLLLLTVMYKPLGLLECADFLVKLPLNAWPLSMTALVKRTLMDMDEELRYTKKVQSMGSIGNQVSQKVRSQYEENPYPRWINANKLPSKCSYESWMADVLLKGERVAFEINNVLVAGCGTGMHPLNLALNVDVNVSAIDITQRSLGYALMMAHKLKANELIDFYHMDLMDVDLLNTTFDVVECSGVLHHMEDPDVGLAELIRVCKPGGYIKLGLYSETARRGVVQVRQAFLKSGMQPTLDNIRAVRSALMSSSSRPECKQVAGFGDFYATSPCRDLLFHAQEHRYTIDMLGDMFKRHNLFFMGMTLERRDIMDDFREKYGSEGNRDLKNWKEYEEANPDTFGNMYQFYVQVPESSSQNVH